MPRLHDIRPRVPASCNPSLHQPLCHHAESVSRNHLTKSYNRSRRRSCILFAIPASLVCSPRPSSLSISCKPYTHVTRIRPRHPARSQHQRRQDRCHFFWPLPMPRQCQRSSSQDPIARRSRCSPKAQPLSPLAPQTRDHHHVQTALLFRLITSNSRTSIP